MESIWLDKKVHLKDIRNLNMYHKMIMGAIVYNKFGVNLSIMNMKEMK